MTDWCHTTKNCMAKEKTGGRPWSCLFTRVVLWNFNLSGEISNWKKEISFVILNFPLEIKIWVHIAMNKTLTWFGKSLSGKMIEIWRNWLFLACHLNLHLGCYVPGGMHLLQNLRVWIWLIFYQIQHHTESTPYGWTHFMLPDLHISLTLQYKTTRNTFY